MAGTDQCTKLLSGLRFEVGSERHALHKHKLRGKSVNVASKTLFHRSVGRCMAES